MKRLTFAGVTLLLLASPVMAAQYSCTVIPAYAEKHPNSLIIPDDGVLHLEIDASKFKAEKPEPYSLPIAKGHKDIAGYLTLSSDGVLASYSSASNSEQDIIDCMKDDVQVATN